MLVETSLEQRRLNKLKTKKAYKCILSEFKAIAEDLDHIVAMENA
jgi:hypothetical protein